MAKKHGNSNKNEKPHHLYEIFDKQKKEVFKYGISSNSIDEDGLSKRVKNQVALFNRLVNWTRFIGKIIIKNITGRIKAKEIEREYIEAFERKHGKKPRGNVE